MPNLHQEFRTRSRRGITLIFVVTMIVLFLLMGTAFVVVSNDFFRTARKRSTRYIHTSDAKSLLERAFYDLARGPSLSNTNSPLRGHSLLADMYGYGVTATVATASANSSGHFVELTLNGDAKMLLDQSTFTPEPITGSLNGLSLGFVSGPAKGVMARIVDHQVSGDLAGGYTHTFFVLPNRSNSNFNITNAAALVDTRIVINGRPFSGTGAGHYNPLTSPTSPALSSSALNPNQVGNSIDEIIGTSGSGYFSYFDGTDTLPNSMGPNESYDSFDYQNMFLAGIKPDGTLEVASFHRESIMDETEGDFRAFDAGGDDDDGISVDNNNDGEDDGIWIDIGLPVENRADGTCVKPLVSYLVLDLDGRININAHGSKYRDGNLNMTDIEFLDSTNVVHKRGQGYGPPEISMNQLLPGTVSQILGATPGRYGSDGFPGEENVRDQWSSYRLFGYPNDEYAAIIPGTVDGHFGSTMDIHGRFSVGYPMKYAIGDPTFPIGMPEASVRDSSLVNEIVDSPYEVSFQTGNSVSPTNKQFDSLYTAGELESVFRQNDPDSQLLPSRLLNMGSEINSAKHSLTTHSFEVPTSYENLPSRIYSILDVVSGDAGIPSTTSNREQVIRDQIRLLMPPEVLRGLPMNVNRAFGDGVDNNGNGVVDEMGESGDELTHPNGDQILFDHDNDSVVDDGTVTDNDAVFARCVFARHLYVMTLLTTERVDRNGDGMVTATADWYDFNEDGTIDEDDWIDYRKMVAQWVANVVDFRDRDSIMTPCEFDLNPWNGWDVDGSILTVESVMEGSPAQEMRLVCWGTERPELLISETFATHDRRTQDLETETVPVGEDAMLVLDGDLDFDSHLVPKPSFFVELYNPWVINDGNQIRPPELYDDNLDGVDLQKTSDGQSPIWRMIVTDIGENELDPDDPENNGGTAATVHRRIYFTNPNFVDSGPEVYYPEADIDAGLLDPGRYAIVGTAGQKVGDRYDTYFGRRLTPTALEPDEMEDMTRRISLDPTNAEVQIVQWDEVNSEMVSLTRDVVNIPIGLNNSGWRRDLGVSDPVEGYFNLSGEGGIDVELTEIVDGWKFTEDVTTPGTPTDFAFDEPIDRKIDEDHYEKYLKSDGLLDNEDPSEARPPYRVVHLQRLANPLLPFEATNNPYRTIDTCGIDLFAFNGVESVSDPNNAMPGIMRFGTHERRGSPDSDFGQMTDRDRVLFKSDLLGLQAPVAETPFNGLDEHVFSWNFLESLGGINQAYIDSDPGAEKPFCALTWNNRPFVSQLELANVPHTSSYWLTRMFDISDDVDVYDPPSGEDAIVGDPSREFKNYSGRFPHLLNFYTDQTDGAFRGPSLHRLMDFVEVPSRFIGTESYVNPSLFANDLHGVSFGLAAPFDSISNYRYPGKLNVNTVLDPKVWNGLMGGNEGYGVDANGVSYPDWETSRSGTSTRFDYANPLRPACANNLVPLVAGDDLVVEPVDCGLFRADGTEPLFDYNPATKVPHANDDRAAYFRNDMRQRLGNLVTTRSSVFAVWVTIGYFEVEPDGSLRPGPDDEGVEAGINSGEVHRPRAFFLIDRSIPVAFEPGANHNIDQAVLIKSIISK